MPLLRAGIYDAAGRERVGKLIKIRDVSENLWLRFVRATVQVARGCVSCMKRHTHKYYDMTATFVCEYHLVITKVVSLY